jgi:hypothetical protein
MPAFQTGAFGYYFTKLVCMDTKVPVFKVGLEFFINSYLMINTELSKSHAIHSWHMFYLSKNKLQTKNNVIISVGNAHRIQRCMHSLFSSCLMQPGEEFLCHGNGSPDEIFISKCLWRWCCFTATVIWTLSIVLMILTTTFQGVILPLSSGKTTDRR